VIGDTVGDPFKDTSSVALNPVIKFTTLFGVLAVGLALRIENSTLRLSIAAIAFVISMVFAWRSFYAMRIESVASKK
jgi:K(+)-stimulated pyrophosphate-energized sodium pump